MNHSRMNAGNARNYSFATSPSADVPRSRLWRPSSHKTTINSDYLYPLFCDEVLPGDTFRLDVATFARMTTAICPFMDSLYVDWQFFFVPSRLVWDHWQNFCGEKEDPDDDTEYTMPYLASAESTAPSTPVAIKSMSLYDYFGLPVGVTLADHDVQSLPFRCYNLIWNEWYRDEHIQSKVPVPKDDGPDYEDEFVLLKRGKRKDYFTSCLPQPQDGPAVAIPLVESTTLQVRGTGMAMGLTNGTTNCALGQNSSNLAMYSSDYGADAGIAHTGSASSTTKTVGLTTDPDKSGIEAIFDDPSAVTINALRQAFQLQKFAERMMRGGNRYIEILRSMFGVTSPDARLQRPELLTAFTVPVQLYQNVQSSSSEDGSTPQGNLAANGTAAGLRFAFSKSFVEHGYIIGLCSVRSDLSYQQGLHRMWSRSTKYDFYWPSFAHLGEQAVLNKEIYYSNADQKNDDAFGYQERWAEYKYGSNKITGELRSTYDYPLDLWHLAQNFSSRPTLSPEFIESNTPLSRVLAVSPDEAGAFVLDAQFNLVCARPLPVFDTPGLVDHF